MDFDRMLGALHGLPDVLKTKPTTIQSVVPLLGTSATYIVQTYRRKDEKDDYAFTAFLQIADGSGLTRVVLPDKVIDAVVMQRYALQRKGRRLKGKELAAARKAAGIEPGFMKARRGKRS